MSEENPELAELKAKLTAIEAENASLKATAEAATAALNEHKRAATHAEHAAFADSLIKAGKLTPGVAPAMVATLDHLAESPADFAEGEGNAMPVVNIAATAATATVKKFARGVEVTDEALLASYDDPLKEVARQFARYAARAADRELITAAETSTLLHTASGTIALNDIVDAIGKWNDASVNISGLVVHSKVYRDLIKLAEFKTLTQKADSVIEKGVVGMVYGVPIRVSDAITTVAGSPNTYRNLLLKKGALGLWYQRNMNVETERDTIKRTTVITADSIFATAMFQDNPLPVVKLVTQ